MVEVGEMLRLARQRRGFTQKDASARLGIVQPLLSRLENGVSEPDEPVLTRAAIVYDLPRAFFDLREPVYGPPVSVHPMARAKADVTSRELDMVTAELNIRVMHIRKFLDSIEFEPEKTIPQLDIDQYESVEKITSIVRAHWSMPKGPVKNIMNYVEKAGAIVGISDFSGASVSGITFRAPGQPPLILLNGAHPADRMRFTLAHEIGHLVMHRFPSPNMEQEANEFASCFLMPKAEIEESLTCRRITLDYLASLKPEWRVSMQAILMRAKSLDLIDYNQNRYLWQQISARGWRLREPPELDFPAESPSVMKSIIRNHISVLGYSLQDLCGLVPMYEADFLKLYGSDGLDGPERPKLRLVV